LVLQSQNNQKFVKNFMMSKNASMFTFDTRTVHVAFLVILFVAANFAIAQENTWPYRVQAGDTLRSIAARHLGGKGHWQQLQTLNRLKNPDRIAPGATLRIPGKLATPETISATIAFVEGSAEHRPIGASTSQALAKGAAIRQGDQIQTGANGSATVDFLDGSQLVILRDSIVTFKTLQGRSDTRVASIQIDLKQGRVETRVTPRKNKKSLYEIITPTVQIGVRGTEFRVKVDDAGELTRTEVLEGKVAAENSLGKETVPKDFGTLVEKNQAPRPPIALLPAPIAPTLLVTPTAITAHWPGLPEASSYRVMISANANFSQLVGEYITPLREITLAPLPAGRYFLRLRGVDSSGLEGRASDRTIEF
jgi:LysM repeat protein